MSSSSLCLPTPGHPRLVPAGSRPWRGSPGTAPTGSPVPPAFLLDGLGHERSQRNVTKQGERCPPHLLSSSSTPHTSAALAGPSDTPPPRACCCSPSATAASLARPCQRPCHQMTFSGDLLNMLFPTGTYTDTFSDSLFS